MDPKIDPCGTPKSIFRKSLNSDVVFFFYGDRQKIEDSNILS